MNCPLCRSKRTREFSRDKNRIYHECRDCSLVFVRSSQFLSPEDEKKRYDLHQNSPADEGYRSYLNRLFIPMQQVLSPGSSGLDFGSGPEPVLSGMFREAGFRMTLFDRFYEPDPVALEKQYEFIVACEVVEHLRDVGSDLGRVWTCLKPGGRLGIMTQFAPLPEAFAHWQYKNDPTHVCFFPRAAFLWLAGHWHAELTFAENEGVVIFKKAEPLNLK